MLPSDRPGRVQERSHLGHRWVTAQADRSLDDYAVHWLRDLGQLIGRRPAIRRLSPGGGHRRRVRLQPREIFVMLTVTGLELRAGARLLLDAATFRVGSGDRVGLVGRNGAGKTTLCKVLAGEGIPAARTGDRDTIARDRVLSARGIDELLRGMEKAQIELAERPHDDALIRRYGRLEEQFTALGGYAVEAEAERICSNLGLPDRVLDQPLGTLSGGQRRRVELARILFSGAETLLLDEPTNHLDADSIAWLREFLRSHHGGLVVIS